MCTALQSWNGIAVGIQEGIDFGSPRNCPLNCALAVLVGNLTKKGAGNGCCRAQCDFEEIEQTAGKFQSFLRRDLPFRLQQRWFAFPAYLNAAEEIGLRSRHA